MEPTSTIPECRQDGAATRLACAACGAPICPRCMTRTAVGFKCPDCMGPWARAAHGAGSKARPPGRRRPPVWAAAAAVVALVAAATLALRPGNGPAGDPVGTPARAEAPPAGQPALGEEASDGQISFVVIGFSCGEAQIGGRAAEGTFCRMALRARNRSGAPATLLGRFQYLLDGQKTFGPDIPLSATLAGNAGVSELTINPDITVDLVLVYDVPTTLEPLEAQLRGTGASRFGVRVRLQARA